MLQGNTKRCSSHGLVTGKGETCRPCSSSSRGTVHGPTRLSVATHSTHGPLVVPGPGPWTGQRRILEDKSAHLHKLSFALIVGLMSPLWRTWKRAAYSPSTLWRGLATILTTSSPKSLTHTLLARPSRMARVIPELQLLGAKSILARVQFEHQVSHFYTPIKLAEITSACTSQATGDLNPSNSAKKRKTSFLPSFLHHHQLRHRGT
eukprot:6262680-Amphidinium_carterae.3